MQSTSNSINFHLETITASVASLAHINKVITTALHEYTRPVVHLQTCDNHSLSSSVSSNEIEYQDDFDPDSKSEMDIKEPSIHEDQISPRTDLGLTNARMDTEQLISFGRIMIIDRVRVFDLVPVSTSNPKPTTFTICTRESAEYIQQHPLFLCMDELGRPSKDIFFDFHIYGFQTGLYFCERKRLRCEGGETSLVVTLYRGKYKIHIHYNPKTKAITPHTFRVR